MRTAKRIELTDAERTTLESWSRGRSTPARLVLRAKIVLAAADGDRNDVIAAALTTAKTTVVRWRKRFASGRVAGIERDAPRAGRKPTIPTPTVEAIVRKTTQETPADATHWSTRTMARAVGVSKATVSRIWRAAGLKPHLARTFKVSNDPKFVEKVRDVVGLYLNPPENALVLSCDEKSQIQALDRTQKSLPMMPGRLGTLTHDYKRNGTTTLFAAIDAVRGTVIGTLPRHRHQGVDPVPDADRRRNAGRIGLAPDRRQLCDAQASEGESVAAETPPVPRPFHSDEQFVAERGRAVVSGDHREADPPRDVPERPPTGRGDRAFIATHNRVGTAFTWTATADNILAKVERARAALDKTRSD